MKRVICLLSLLTLPMFFAFGQDADAENSTKNFDIKFSGLQEFDYRLPLDSSAFNYDGEMKTPMFRNQLGLDLKYGDINIVSHWQVDIFNNPLQMGTDSWSASTRIRFLENYVAWNPDNFKFAAGYQIYAWGVADGLNPTDNTDMTDGMPTKIPVLSASVNWYPTENISLETVFAPVPQDSLFPLDYQALLGSYGFPNVTYTPLENTPSNSI